MPANPRHVLPKRRHRERVQELAVGKPGEAFSVAVDRLTTWINARETLRALDPAADFRFAYLTRQIHLTLHSLAQARASGDVVVCSDLRVDRIISAVAARLAPVQEERDDAPVTWEGLDDVTPKDDPAYADASQD